MNQAVLLGLFRHILTAVAGGALVKYGIDGATIDAIVAGATAVVGVAWSVWDKRVR